MRTENYMNKHILGGSHSHTEGQVAVKEESGEENQQKRKNVDPTDAFL